MALDWDTHFQMKTYRAIYQRIISLSNLIWAERKARKGKTTRSYVIEFEKNLLKNLNDLHYELKNQTYKPKPLKTFVLRDPKTRKISKSDFRDRVIHHAIINVLEPIFDKGFIFDSCANRKGKGNLFALKRFNQFARKVSKNGRVIQNRFNDNNMVNGYCLKADIKHYFQEVNQSVLINMIQRKIKDKQTLWLIKQIISNISKDANSFKGMPLGNLTSQFFANLYLNELDQFVKHQLKAKYYIRYVDDFIILHYSKGQLMAWKDQIEDFLQQELKLTLHPDKSKILHLFRGVDFVGFRNFYYFSLLRRRNIKKMKNKCRKFKLGETDESTLREIFQGWQAYAKWANTHKLRKCIMSNISAFN